ncbi:hypothetical protein GE21DRAFT_1287894 [Neurospora crassa]|nr:hypothetical protein GE21DRAFT_1287894 [Neurospora crassa]
MEEARLSDTGDRSPQLLSRYAMDGGQLGDDQTPPDHGSKRRLQSAEGTHVECGRTGGGP